MSNPTPTQIYREALADIFIKGVRGVAAQGFQQSLGTAGSCRYRGEEGRACIIGHCMPDSVYDDDFESGWYVRDLPAETLVACGLPETYLADSQSRGTSENLAVQALNFLEGMQLAHDHSHTPFEMRLTLRNLISDWPSIQNEVERKAPDVLELITA